MYDLPCSVFISDALFSDQFFPYFQFRTCHLALAKRIVVSTMPETGCYKQRQAAAVVVMAGRPLDVEELFVVHSQGIAERTLDIKGPVLDGPFLNPVSYVKAQAETSFRGLSCVLSYLCVLPDQSP